MNTGDVGTVKAKCTKAGSNFVFKDGERDEDYASFYFVGDYDGKEVVFDAFMYTLQMEFNVNRYEDAREAVIQQHPKFADADFDALEGEHIDLMEEIAASLADDEDYEVQESVEVDEDCDEGVAIDICLNVEEVNEETISNFIKEFTSGTLELDENFYSFTEEEEED